MRPTGERRRELCRAAVAFWALNSLPARLRREGFGCWPNWFAGKTRMGLRRLARRRMAELAERFPGTEFGALAGAAAQADARRSDRHAWIIDILRVVAAALEKHPPARENWHIRREALLLLDFALQVRSGRRWRAEAGRFYQEFMTRALAEIAETNVTRGLRVWKMYNMGFVVKSRNHCVGFDIHPGSRRSGPLSPQQQRRLAGLLDVAFVSHPHFDHLHPGFVKLVLAAGGKVVLPATARPRLQHPNIVRARNEYDQPTRIGDVEVRCFPGWQRMMSRNKVYLVRLDGYHVLHNGDNTRHGVYLRLAEAGPIDVMLANCWAGFGSGPHLSGAGLLITGHENELSHSVSMRAPFRYTYSKLSRLGLAPAGEDGPEGGRPECHILSWGESIDWRPSR